MSDHAQAHRRPQPDRRPVTPAVRIVGTRDAHSSDRLRRAYALVLNRSEEGETLPSPVSANDTGDTGSRFFSTHIIPDKPGTLKKRGARNGRD